MDVLIVVDLRWFRVVNVVDLVTEFGRDPDEMGVDITDSSWHGLTPLVSGIQCDLVLWLQGTYGTRVEVLLRREFRYPESRTLSFPSESVQVLRDPPEKG